MVNEIYSKGNEVNNKRQSFTNLSETIQEKISMFFYKKKTDVFDNIIRNARKIANEDPCGLQTLVYSLIRPLQSEQIIQVCERADHAARSKITSDTFFSDNRDFISFEEKKDLRVDPHSEVVDLSRDAVIPTPWQPLSIAEMFASYGEGRKAGPWRQDNNHSVEFYLPWRIGFVLGGNHSIAAGILRGEGSIKPNYVYDLTEKLRKVKTDGIDFISVESNKIICPAVNQRVAAIWEIGRMMSNVDN